MFGKRKERVILEVTADEMRILRKTMLLFRNRMIEAGKPTEDIEEVIGKLVFRRRKTGKRPQDAEFCGIPSVRERDKSRNPVSGDAT